jgi:heme-degrading monooxygenase HmoA
MGGRSPGPDLGTRGDDGAEAGLSDPAGARLERRLRDNLAEDLPSVVPPDPVGRCREEAFMYVTIVEGAVDAAREDDLRSAWEEKTAVLPDGLIESSLLRADDGIWRIVTVWESKDAVMAMRASGERPAAPVMFERAGSEPAVSMWTVEDRVSRT